MSDALNLVFDLDGTLIDSAPQIHATANIVFENMGLAEFPYEAVRGFIGNGVGILVSRLMSYQGLGAEHDLHASLVTKFIKIYEEAFDLTTLYPGVVEMLSDLSDTGHRLAICTNKPAGPALAVLRHFDVLSYFSVVIGGDTLPQRKPDPAPLRAAIQALGPGNTLFVGDSEVDAETSLAAGVPFALYTNGYRKTAPDALGAKLVFDDHAILPRLIAHLAPRL